MIAVPIHTEHIRLSQFLKLANVVGDGVEAKFLILEGHVKVNGEVESRRGRKLRPGDRVVVADRMYQVMEEELI
jgi:ribosome-associated protein